MYHTVVPCITLPLYNSKSITFGLLPTLHDSIFYHITLNKPTSYDTPVIDTALYDSMMHKTLYKLPLYFIAFVFQRYIIS